MKFKNASVWAATTKDEHYLRAEGLKRVVSFPEHRKEFVAGNMSEFVTTGTYDISVPVRFLFICPLVFKDATLHVGDFMNIKLC